MAVGDTQFKVDFASRLAKDSNLDFYTVLGWEQAEGGVQGNPLGLGGATPGTAQQEADEVWKNLQNGLYANVVSVAAQKFATPDAEIAAEAHAIAQSPWNNPAQKGSASRAQYEKNIDSAALVALYAQIQPNSKITPGGIQNPAENPGGLIGGIAGGLGGISDAVGSIGSAFSWITNGENDLRVIMAIGGGVAILLGAYVAFRG